ncbi:MAG: hypothetical protein GYA21_09250 [Myxococcales bacterium]|nr:hypothetical protein [Myxococcales bacterium]
MKFTDPLLCILFSCSLAFADDAMPGVGQKPIAKEDEAKEKGKDKGTASGEEEITVLGQRIVRESEIVGSYNQPFWTASRRFPTTRVYVMPAGSVTFEYWVRADGLLRSGDRARFRNQYELEFGLGHRLQLDLYLETRQSSGYEPIAIKKEKIELRWAFADWGVIPGNPTLYLEWVRASDDPQAIEAKILLGDAISPRLFWGFNLVYERELGGESTGEYAASFGVAYALVDGVVSVGLEGVVELVDVSGSRFDFVEKNFLVGPSLLVRPISGVHIDILAMAGAAIEDETEPAYRVFFILGKHFDTIGLR